MRVYQCVKWRDSGVTTYIHVCTCTKRLLYMYPTSVQSPITVTMCVTKYTAVSAARSNLASRFVTECEIDKVQETYCKTNTIDRDSRCVEVHFGKRICTLHVVKTRPVVLYMYSPVCTLQQRIPVESIRLSLSLE